MLRVQEDEDDSDNDTKNNQAVKQQETEREYCPSSQVKKVFHEGTKDQLFQKLLRCCVQ